MYDIAIIGAGPAGATLARLIGKKYRVLLIDKRKLTNRKIMSVHSKCCGGLVAPDAQKMLAYLGLGLPAHVLVGPQLFVVRTIDLHQNFETYYQRHYINIDRDKFDRWLVSLIPTCVDLKMGCFFKNYEVQEDCYVMNLLYNKRSHREYAKVIIGADGADSQIRKQCLSDYPSPKTYIGIQEWFTVDNTLPYYTAIFDRDVTDFYSWIIPKNDFLIIGSALIPQQSTLEKFEMLKQKLRQYGFRFGKSMKRKSGLLLRPLKVSQLNIGKKRIALVGEAAGWISPSSAEGLSYAFSSAVMLARALHKGMDNFLYRYYRNTTSLRRNIVFKNLKSPFMYNPWLRKIIMKSTISSMQLLPPHLRGV